MEKGEVCSSKGVKSNLSIDTSQPSRETPDGIRLT